MATLLAHWETSLNKSTVNSRWHLEASVNIVECMRRVRRVDQIRTWYSNITALWLDDPELNIKILLIIVAGDRSMYMFDS